GVPVHEPEHVHAEQDVEVALAALPLVGDARAGQPHVQPLVDAGQVELLAEAVLQDDQEVGPDMLPQVVAVEEVRVESAVGLLEVRAVTLGEPRRLLVEAGHYRPPLRARSRSRSICCCAIAFSRCCAMAWPTWNCALMVACAVIWAISRVWMSRMVVALPPMMSSWTDWRCGISGTLVSGTACHSPFGSWKMVNAVTHVTSRASPYG